MWIVILIGWTASFILAGLLECGHHLKALFSTPQEYLNHCGSAIPSGWAWVGSDIATDFITLIIPIPIVSIHEAVKSAVLTSLIRCFHYSFRGIKRFLLPLLSWLVHCKFMANNYRLGFDFAVGPLGLVSPRHTSLSQLRLVDIQETLSVSTYSITKISRD